VGDFHPRNDTTANLKGWVILIRELMGDFAGELTIRKLEGGFSLPSPLLKKIPRLLSIAKSGRAQSRVNPEPQDSGQNNDPTKVYPWKRVKLL